MTKEEEIKANVAVQTVRRALDMALNDAIEARYQLALAEARIVELEKAKDG